MSNKVIRAKMTSGGAKLDWPPLVAGLAALAGLATQLPGPAAVVGVFVGTAESSPGGAMAPADTAALVVASCLVWPLLGWGLVVALLSVLCRVPGLLGGAALRGLRVLVPRTLRPMLVAGVGLGLAAGLAGCSQAGVTGSGAGAAAQGSAATGPITAVIRMAGEVGGTAGPPAQPQVPGSATGAAALAPDAVDLDWPTDDRSAPASREPSIAIDWPQTAPGRGSHRTTAHPATNRSAAKTEAPRVSPGERDPHSHPGRRTATPVTVKAGDSLWSIAASRLSTDPTDLQIDRSWREWYSANSALIGSDPNLILPGQQLLPPTSGDLP